jgi:hypothetical protein
MEKTLPKFKIGDYVSIPSFEIEKAKICEVIYNGEAGTKSLCKVNSTNI